MLLGFWRKLRSSFVIPSTQLRGRRVVSRSVASQISVFLSVTANQHAECLEDRTLLSIGDLDPTFGDGGEVRVGFDSSLIGAETIALQDNGMIVVAGTAYDVGTGNDFQVVRYRSNGKVDTAFAVAGTVTTDLGSSDDFAHAVAIQADGKIVVAGTTVSQGSGTYSDFAVSRYNDDGTLDTSFGVDGKVTTDFGGSSDVALHVVLQSDGRIVVAGYSSSGLGFFVALARYNSDGTLDTAFDGDGRLIDFGAPYHDACGIVVQGDGKIVIGGYIGNDGWEFSLSRYGSDGTLDTSFDGDGRLTTSFGDGNTSSVTSLAVQNDGKILAAGWTYQDEKSEFALARYNIDGTLDTKFDSDGKATTEFGGAVARSVTIQYDGRIVVAGSSGRLALARFNIDGSLDATFDGDGMWSQEPSFSIHEVVNSVEVQRDGQILIAGWRTDDSISPYESEFLLARYIGEETVTVTLPVQGITAQAFLIGDKLHLRRSRNAADLVPPVTVTNTRGMIRIEGSDRADRITFDRSMSVFQGSIVFIGGDGNDLVDTRTGGATVAFNGGDGDDSFLGGSGDDSVVGDSGNDNLSGGGGNDSLDGGAGADQLQGGAGQNLLIGGSGNDTLRGGAGADTLLGDAGQDLLSGDAGHDVIDGGDDHDTLAGGVGNDSLRGGNGNDRIIGGNGNDLLIGSAGNDVLQGDAGLDTLLGNSGNDTLNGGAGSDTINAGTGSDRIADSSRVIDTSFSFDFDELLAELL